MAALQTPGLDAVIESVVTHDTDGKAGGTDDAKGLFQKEMISIMKAGRRLCPGIRELEITTCDFKLGQPPSRCTLSGRREGTKASRSSLPLDPLTPNLASDAR
jgi:hypothetical protein